MDETRYQVVLLPGIREGQDPQQAKEALARLFHTEAGRIEQLLQKAPTPLKRNLDSTTARKMVQAVEATGLLVRLEPFPAPESPLPPPVTPPPPPKAEPIPEPLPVPALSPKEEKRRAMLLEREERQATRQRTVRSLTFILALGMILLWATREKAYWEKALDLATQRLAAREKDEALLSSLGELAKQEKKTPAKEDKKLAAWDEAHPRVADKAKEILKNPETWSRVVAELTPEERVLLNERLTMEEQIRRGKPQPK